MTSYVLNLLKSIVRPWLDQPMVIHLASNPIVTFGEAPATVRIKRLTPTAVLPRYATAGAAGMDLSADIPESVLIGPGETKVIPTGIAVAVPEHFEAQCRPRSGLAAKNSMTVLNAPGTIDSDYRGEVKVILHNASMTTFFTVNPGDRIAQLVIARVPPVTLEEVEELDETERGENGFGSTGLGAAA